MKKTLYIIIVLLASVFINGCSKSNAGGGGKAQISVKVINGNSNVGNAEVFVMYNARSFPGSDATYSKSIIADHTGLAEFKNLRRGDYYFYSSETINGTLEEGVAYINIASKSYETHVVIDYSQDMP